MSLLTQDHCPSGLIYILLLSALVFLHCIFDFFFLRFKPDHKTEISIYIFLYVCLSSKYIFKVLSSHLIATEEYYSQKKKRKTGLSSESYLHINYIHTI